MEGRRLQQPSQTSFSKGARRAGQSEPLSRRCLRVRVGPVLNGELALSYRERLEVAARDFWCLRLPQEARLLSIPLHSFTFFSSLFSFPGRII